MATKKWMCPRCGIGGEHMRTPDPERCAACCMADAAGDLYAALRGLDALYARAWDLVEPNGAVTFFPETVATFERLHEAASHALALARGETSRREGGTPQDPPPGKETGGPE